MGVPAASTLDCFCSGFIFKSGSEFTFFIKDYECRLGKMNEVQQLGGGPSSPRSVVGSE